MFAYSDPTGTGFLQQAGALQTYRELVDFWYKRLNSLQSSGFTLREAFDDLAPGTSSDIATVDWKAFPLTAPTTPEKIDRNRFQFQDEYVEWRVETMQDGSLAQVTFTSEFSEYFEALARANVAALKDEIRNLYPGANPIDQELFGSGFNPGSASPEVRGDRFRKHLPDNPWNNGQRGILCLTHTNNTMGALFNLLGHCGVPNSTIAVGAVCATVDGFCGPGRNSDPRVCAAAQTLARNDRSFTLQDPAGIRLLRLDGPGSWTVDGQNVDINDETASAGAWKVTRGGKRAVLSFRRNVLFNGAPIRTGTQLSNLLFAGSDVIHASNAALPEWARPGNEQTRGPIG